MQGILAVLTVDCNQVKMTIWSKVLLKLSVN